MENFPGGWIASLSDGSTVFESKPVLGERTPWQKLLDRCRKDESLSITMIRLQYGPITIMAMPQKMCDGYFQAREAEHIYYRNVNVSRHGIGSVVGDQVFITWLEFTKDSQVYIRHDVRPLDTCRVHTTVMEAQNDSRQGNINSAGGGETAS